jgi:membrane-bound lytic murein transglycosylase MltF
MKNNIFAAVFAIAALAPTQIFAQAKEGQTPEQQVQEVINIIRAEISESFPGYQETTKWNLSKDDSVRLSQEVHGASIINIGENAQYLWFSNNSDNTVNAILESFTEELRREFMFDLYQIGYVGEGDDISLVVFLDYQNPVTLEDLQKAALKGTGFNPSDFNQ